MQVPASDRKKLNWSVKLVIILLICFGSIHVIIDLTEFYKVGIQKNTTGYPWGLVNENSWYFSSPSTYATFCLVSAILILSAVGFAIYSLVTKKERYTRYGIALFFFFPIIKIAGRFFVD